MIAGEPNHTGRILRYTLIFIIALTVAIILMVML